MTQFHKSELMRFNYKNYIVSFVILSFSIGFVGCTGLTTAEGWGSPLIHDSTLIAATMDDQIIFLNLDDGSAVANHIDIRYSENEMKRAIYGQPVSSPIYYDGSNELFEELIFVATYNGWLHAILDFSENDYEIIESEKITDSQIIGGILTFDNKIYLGTTDGEDGELYSFQISLKTNDRGNPEVSFEDDWSMKFDGGIWSTPFFYNNDLILTTLDGHVHSVDLEGNLNWSKKFDSAISSSPLVINQQVLFGGFDSTFYSLDFDTGEINWTFDEAENWYWATPVESNGIIFAPSLDGNIYALDIDSGRKKWEMQTGDAIVGSPVIINDLIVSGSKDGSIYVAEVKSGEILGQCNIDEKIESDIIADPDSSGVIYFSARDHSFRALKIKSNGNPDEYWEAPYFSDKLKDDKLAQPNDWAPNC